MLPEGVVTVVTEMFLPPLGCVIQACTARSPIHASGDAKPPLRHGRCIAVVVSSLRGALGLVARYVLLASAGTFHATSADVMGGP